MDPVTASALAQAAPAIAQAAPAFAPAAEKAVPVVGDVANSGFSAMSYAMLFALATVFIIIGVVAMIFSTAVGAVVLSLGGVLVLAAVGLIFYQSWSRNKYKKN